MPKTMTKPKAWVDETPGIRHVTFSGHKTPCDWYVIEALPVYESKLEDVTCDPCGGFVVYDVTALEKAIRTHIKADPAAKSWLARSAGDTRSSRRASGSPQLR